MNFAEVTNNIAFREIFGNDSKKKSLISFLNAILEFPENKKIIDVEITNPYQLGILSGSGSTIVEVKAKDQSGNTFKVETQIAEHEHFHKRILYYTSQSYTVFAICFRRVETVSAEMLITKLNVISQLQKKNKKNFLPLFAIALMSAPLEQIVC